MPGFCLHADTNTLTPRLYNLVELLEGGPQSRRRNLSLELGDDFYTPDP